MIEDVPKRDYSKYSVLLVDDEPFARSLLRRLLSRLGFERIVESQDGFDALSVIDDEKVPVDLILCDLMMPNLDGIELIYHLSERAQRPAIVFFSGAEDSVLRAAYLLGEAHQLQVLGSVSKPVLQMDLARILVELDNGPDSSRTSH